MYIVKTDEKFFTRFNLLQLKIKELSCLFQNDDIEVSDIEVQEWNTIAYKLRNELDNLIREGNNRLMFMEN